MNVIKKWRHRDDMIIDLAKTLKPRVACEVGVQGAVFSQIILKQIPALEKFYLVDPWEQQTNYKDMANVTNEQHEQILSVAKHRISPWEDKVVILRGYSTVMCKQIPDNSLDFVYIDARHDYKGCQEDINAFWPKVKTGGVMAGHDYLNFHDTQEIFKDRAEEDWSICYDGSINHGAVKGAVNEFAQDINLDVYVTYVEHFPSWLVYK